MNSGAVRFAVVLIAVSACAPTVAVPNAGTIPNDQASFAAADGSCRAMGKFALVRYIDPITQLLSFECVDR